MNDLKHSFAQADGLKMHYVSAGKGPLVVLLHGFPQFWYSWRRQIPVLAEHFQVVAPDLPGYGDTDKPPNIADYRTSVLAADIASLIKSLGHEKAHIIGHDWGGSVAWKMAQENPQCVDRLAVLNSPHPYKMAKALSSSFAQMRKSWYIFFFQLPYLPELLLKRNGEKLLKSMFRSTVRKDAFSEDDIKRYVEAFYKPGVIHAALNYYRAAFRSRGKGDDAGKQLEKKDRRIEAPTLLIWGEDDQALGKELTENMEPLFKGPFRLEYIPHCSHWVHEEQPDHVNRLLLDFLK